MIPIILVSTEICPHVIGLTVIEFCADGNCFHWFSFCFVILCFFSVNTTSRLKCFGWVCCVDCCEILDKHLAVRALVIFAIEVLLDRNIFFFTKYLLNLWYFVRAALGKHSARTYPRGQLLHYCNQKGLNSFGTQLILYIFSHSPELFKTSPMDVRMWIFSALRLDF